MRKLLQHSTWSLAMTIVTVSIGLLISIITARFLGPAGRGNYVLALLLINTIGFAANPGIYAAANYYASSEQLIPEKVFRTSFGLTVPFSLVAFVAGVSLYLVLARGDNLQVDRSLISLLVGIGATSAVLGSSMNGVLFGSKRVRALAIWTMVLAIGQGIFAVASIRLINVSTTYFVGVYAISLAVDAIGKVSLAKNDRGWGLPAWSDAVNFLRYGGQVHVGRVMMYAAQRLDTYLVFILAGEVALGYYSISTTFAEQMWLLPMSVSLVMMTNIANLELKEAAEMTTRASQIVASLAALAAICLGILGAWLIPALYGEQFRPSVAPFLIMLPGMIAICSYPIIEPFFQSRHKPWIPTKITIGGALGNLMFSMLLIPAFGLIGAAIAFSASYILQLLLVAIAFTKFTGQPRLAPIDISKPAQLALQTAKVLVQTKAAKALRDAK